MSAAPSTLGVVVATPAPSAPVAVVVPPPPATTTVPPIWPRSAQVASVVLLLAVLGLLTWHVYGMQRRAARPTVLEPGSLAFRVDLNRADRAQLLQLPGIGEALVQRIEEYRTAHYGFRNVEELANIPGIGPLTVERLRHLVYVEPLDDDEEPHLRVKPGLAAKKIMAATGKSTGVKKDVARTTPVDVNKATAEELQSLPGIGPAMAERILVTRKKGVFKSVDDLRHVPGIGAKTLEKLRPHVTVGGVKEDLTKKD